MVGGGAATIPRGYDSDDCGMPWAHLRMHAQPSTSLLSPAVVHLPPKQVVLSLLAGTDTTAVTLTRILQLLATSDDREEIVDRLIQELRNDAVSDDDGLDDTAGTGSGSGSVAGILGEFPLLDAVILEAFR